MKSLSLISPLVAMLCVGAVSTCSQVVLLREMLAAFSGNELTIGGILGIWLLGVAAGASACRLFLHAVRSRRVSRGLFACLLLLLACLLPLQVLFVRHARLLLGVGVAAYASLGQIVLVAAVAGILPCLAVGFCFPLATRLAQHDDLTVRLAPASRVYTAEGAGSALVGALLTFVLLGRLDVVQVVLFGCAVSIAGATALIHGRLRWAVVIAGAAAVCLSVADVGPAPSLRTRLDNARWKPLGATVGATGQSGGTRLVATTESVYQSLGLTESEGQFALYGNSEPLMVFPDAFSYEHDIHFLMAQKPGAGRILVLGGNPVGELPELLKYDPDQLVYVSLDPAIGDLIERALPGLYTAVMGDESVHAVAGDAVHVVRGLQGRFDAIVLNAPAPSTVANNRFYCRSFVRDLRRLLAPGGFLTCRVPSSVQLQEESVSLPSSVFHTLREEFEDVLVTAGAHNRFFAGAPSARLSLDPESLMQRSRASGVTCQYFRPEYFLACDETDAERVAFTRERLEAAAEPVNTVTDPAAYRAYMRLWRRVSGSGGRLAFCSRGMLSLGWIAGLCGLFSVAALALGGCLRAVPGARGHRAASRSMVLVVVLSTGLVGMSLEVLLLMLFQALFGYVYAKVGLVVALFMVGLVVGAPSGRRLSGGATGRWRWAYLGTELALVAAPVLLLALASIFLSGVAWLTPSMLAGAMYAGVGCIGWLVGAQFPMANRIFLDTGSPDASAAARVDAADHAGAAVGAFSTGALLIPLFGMDGALWLFTMLKGVSIACLVAAFLAMSTRRGSHADTSDTCPGPGGFR